MRLRHFHLGSQNGFTLVELIIVIVVLGIVSAYAVMRGMPVAEVTLPSQAQKMASDIRHAQTLAYTTGQRMRLAITAGANGIYTVNSCVSIDNCPTEIFRANLQKNVVLGGTTTIDFNTLGWPSARASYTLGSGATVCVAALTGFVSVIFTGTCPS